MAGQTIVGSILLWIPLLIYSVSLVFILSLSIIMRALAVQIRPMIGGVTASDRSDSGLRHRSEEAISRSVAAEPGPQTRLE